MSIDDPEALSRTIVNSRVVNTPVDDVFDAYANPEKIIRWWGPTGFSVKNDSIDLREGGHWHFELIAPDGAAHPNHQVFEKIERPHVFVVKHVSDPEYLGTVTFEELEGKTRVTMYWTFDRETFAKAKDAVAAGNEGNLDKLEELLAGKR